MNFSIYELIPHRHHSFEQGEADLSSETLLNDAPCMGDKIQVRKDSSSPKNEWIMCQSHDI